MLLNNKCYDVCPDGYFKENGACQGNERYEKVE